MSLPPAVGLAELFSTDDDMSPLTSLTERLLDFEFHNRLNIIAMGILSLLPKPSIFQNAKPPDLQIMIPKRTIDFCSQNFPANLATLNKACV